MRRIVFSFFLLLILLPSLSWAVTVKSGHPRIFINSSNISTLRTRANTTHNATYVALNSWCDKNWTSYGVGKAVPAGGFDFQSGRSYDSGYIRFALIYALGGSITGFSRTHPINEYGRKAVDSLLAFVAAYPTLTSTVGGLWLDLALVYDWCNALMTTNEKTTVVNWWYNIIHAIDMANWGYSPAIFSPEASGYRHPGTPASFYPGLAFYGDGINDSLAHTYVDFIPTFLLEMRGMSHQSGHDGGQASGIGYSKYAYGTFTWPSSKSVHDMHALITATDYTIAQTSETYPFVKTWPIWVLYGLEPGPPTPDPDYPPSNNLSVIKLGTDIGEVTWNIQKNDYPLWTMILGVKELFRLNGETDLANVTAWLLNSKMGYSYLNTSFDILWNDRSISTGTSPEALGWSPVKAFGWKSTGVIDDYMGNPKAGMGWVYMNSSWSGGNESTQAGFKAPPYYYFGHQHYDSLNFSIFKNGPIVVPSGRYFPLYEGLRPEYSATGRVGYPHQHYYNKTSTSGNAPMILDPNEQLSEGEGAAINTFGAQRYFNDGNSTWGDNVPGGNRDTGGLIAFENTIDYTYASGDGTKAYNSVVGGVNYLNAYGISPAPKVSLVQRDFVYLKSGARALDDYFVIFDRITSTNASFTKVFQLRTVGNPILNGTPTVIYGDTTNGISSWANSDSFSITNGTKNKLFMKTLLPMDKTIYKVGGVVYTTLRTALPLVNNVDASNPKIDNPMINIDVEDATKFSDRPSGVIGTGANAEGFSCTGKTSNQLTGCIRGYRYFKLNPGRAHSVGAHVVQTYAFAARSAADGYWYNWPEAYGVTTSQALWNQDEYGRWNIRIESVDSETATNFLTVLHPTVDMTRMSMATTSLITPSFGAAKGAFINDTTTPRIVMFPATTTKVARVLYTASYGAGITGKHLILGLYPSTKYLIYKNGIKITTITSSNQGVVSFSSTGGSDFEVSRYMINDH